MKIAFTLLSVVVTAGASRLTEEQAVASVVLLQTNAVVKAASAGIGNSVPITEKGYQLVAEVKNDNEMKAFVYRVLEKEARYAKDAAELSGLVPFYSGVQGVQSLQGLKKELRDAPWVADGEGRAAALNEEGYQKVAKHKSRPHMMAYARRILDADFKKASDEGALIGLVPYFDGDVSVQSFDQLKRELLSAPWAVPRDSELANLPQVSLSEQTFWPFTSSHETAAQENTIELEVNHKALAEPEDATSKVDEIKKAKVDKLKDIKDEQVARVEEAKKASPLAVNAAKVEETKAENTKAVQVAKVEALKDAKVAKVKEIKDEQIHKVEEAKASNPEDVDVAKVAKIKTADAARIEEIKETQVEEAAVAREQKVKAVEVEKVESTKAAKVQKIKGIKDAQAAKVKETKAADPVQVNVAKVDEIKAADAARIQEAKDAQSEEQESEKAEKIEEIKSEKGDEAQVVEAEEDEQNEPQASTTVEVP